MDKSKFTMIIKPGRAAAILGAVSVVLVALSLTGQSFRFFTLPFELRNSTQEFFLDLFIDKFSVNTENNFPTYFNTIILAIASLLAFVIASGKHALKDKYRFEWSLLAYVFLYLSLDEAAVIHEQFSRLFKQAPDFGGWLHYKWLIPGSIAVIVLAALFLRFFLHLGRRYQILFFLSGAFYLLGALGGELFSGRHANAYGTKNLTYTAMTTGEEMLEWLGVILMIFTLLKYIEGNFMEIRLLVAGKAKILE